jgi:sugar phosphate isomerase/epimerase
MLTRKSFIQRSSIFAAALLIDKSGLFKMHKDLGIQLYTVRDEVSKDLDNSIMQVAKAGYKQVELYGYDYKTRQFFGRSVQQMSDLLKKNNLKTPSGHYGIYDMLYNADYNWDSWKHLIDDATILGNKYIVIPHLDDKHRSADDYKRIADRLNKGGELSKAAGMATGYHNHNFEFESIGDTSAFEYLLKNTDPKLVKFEMDLYWVEYAGQDPAVWFKKYPGRFPLWHIKDMEAKTEGQAKGQTCEVGKGIIDWKSIFAHQAEAGVDYVFVEQEQYRSPVFECIKSSADYMKANLLT